MVIEDISFVADALLALVSREGEPPIYDDFALAAKEKKDAKRAGDLAGLLANADVQVPMHECEGIVESARLTERQAYVVALRLEGFTFAEIGTRKGHTKQGAQRIFVQALKKLGRALREYPFLGLTAVYGDEIARGRTKRRFGTLP